MNNYQIHSENSKNNIKNRYLLNFYLFKKNIFIKGKTKKKVRKFIHDLIQKIIKIKERRWIKKKEIFFENNKYIAKKSVFHNYFYLEIDFKTQEKKNIEKLSDLKREIEKRHYETSSNKVLFVVLHRIDFLEKFDQLELFYLFQNMKNKCFFFATLSKLKKLIKIFKETFFFFPCLEIKKFEKKKKKNSSLIEQESYVLKILKKKKRVKKMVRTSEIIPKNFFLIIISFLVSKVFIINNIFLTLLNSFLKISIFEFSLKSFLIYYSEKNYKFLKISKEYTFFFQDEILFIFKKFFHA